MILRGGVLETDFPRAASAYDDTYFFISHPTNATNPQTEPVHNPQTEPLQDYRTRKDPQTEPVHNQPQQLTAQVENTKIHKRNQYTINYNRQQHRLKNARTNKLN